MNPENSGDERWLERIWFLLGIIVVGLVLAFCFLASSFCIIILLAALLAILVDPVVVKMEALGLGRGLASFLVVLGIVILCGALAYTLYQRADAFTNQLPTYSYRIRKALSPIINEVSSIEQNARDLKNPPDAGQIPEIRISETPDWSSFLARGVGSIWSATVIAAVVPFLLFFMLIRKSQMRLRFLNIFEGRIDAERFLRSLHGMVRAYVLGSLLVGAIMSVATCVLLLIIGLRGAVPLGIVCGFLNIIPFLGFVLATALALAAALLQFSTIGPFIAIAVMLPLLHLVATNLLIPRFVGSRLLVGPVAITVGMLFWGWLWGAIGVLLAVPLTAFIKIIADSHPSLIHLSNALACEPRPVPRWVRAGERTLQKVGPFLRPRVRPPKLGR